MRSSKVLSDRLVAAGFIRPSVLFQGLQLSRPSASRWPVSLLIGLSGLLVEPLAWLQTLLFQQRLRRSKLPPDPVVVIGHWRSGTTFLHQLLASDPAWATARNSLTVAPQAALLLKPLLRLFMRAWMTAVRPIDAVPWSENDPQEDEVGIARLTMDTHMAAMAFPQLYPFHFRRTVMRCTAAYERQWLRFTRLTWLHDGAGSSRLLIKNSAHMARVAMVLRHFPRARFVLLQREAEDSIRSLVQVKQRLAELVGLQPAPDLCTQVEQTVAAHRQLINAFEVSRPLIPADQLLEVDYNDLVAMPLETVQRIYDHFRLGGWDEARGPIRKRISQARSYTADPVQLPAEAQRRLRELLAP